MEWRDTGLVLSARRHGENAAILEVLTGAHGRHLGVVHGGVSKRKAPMLQVGNQVQVVWKARLEDQLGTFTIEPVRSRSAAILGDPLRLTALSAVCALCGFALPEREVLPDFQARTESLVDAIETGEGWLHDYVFWELALLDVTGFRLDLSTCAAGGGANDLAYVSPKTGRAVSRAGAGQWADRLLPLPSMLLGGVATPEGAMAALELTGHFLEQKLAAALGNRPLPAARARFVAELRRIL
ncbi:MAG: DNA repair protein RecO [Pseudomonadota bacterium]